MKKLVLIILVLTLVFSVCSNLTLTALAAESELSNNPDDWDWVKQPSSDGRMTIRTRYEIPGIMVGEDGTQEDAYLVIFQDYEGFFFTILNYDHLPIYNSGETGDIAADCLFVWYEGTDREFTEEFHETWAVNSTIIPLTSSVRGISGVGTMQNALDARSDTAVLYIVVEEIGYTFRFEIPGDTDYDAIWSVASDFWYFPTYNDTLYTGSDANPDLIEFLNDFYDKISDAFEEAKESGAPMAADELARMISCGEDPELTLLYNQYQLLMEHTGGLRTVDYEQIEIIDNWFTQTVMAQNVQDGIEVADELIDVMDDLSPAVRDVFVDFVGDSYDDTMWIVNGLIDLFS